MNGSAATRSGASIAKEPRKGVHIESVGRGPPLVLLHGFALHGGLFAPIVPALARHARVHVIDLPGHGWSPAVEPFDLDTIVAAVDDAVGCARSRDGDPPAPLAILGWSFGGLVAMHWAARFPNNVTRLILVATSPSFVTRPGWPSAMAGETLARFGDELEVAWRLTLQRFLTLQVQGSDEGKRTLATLRGRLFERGDPAPAALAATLALLERSDLRDETASIAAPATLIAGTRDALVPVAGMRALAAIMPRAKLTEIEGAAHAPFLSHPRAFLATLDAEWAPRTGDDG